MEIWNLDWTIGCGVSVDEGGGEKKENLMVKRRGRWVGKFESCWGVGFKFQLFAWIFQFSCLLELRRFID